MDMDKDMDRVRDEGLRMDMGTLVARPVERERMRVSELVRHVDSQVPASWPARLMAWRARPGGG